jgi:sortase A
MNHIVHRLLAILLLSSFALAACQGLGPISPLLVAEKVLLHGSSGSATPEAIASPVISAAPAAEAVADSLAVASDTTLTDNTAPVAEATPAATGIVAALTTADYSSTMPVALAIPAIGLQAQVTPMGWEPVLINDQVSTRWLVPEQTLGWAVNSAGVGDPGNVIIVGHQALGAVLFRPLALGEMEVGQEIQLQAADGTTHLYRVSEVSAPITAIGASAEEVAQATTYMTPTTDARLTLVSGWPADATTHRLFVVAEYVGESNGVQP